MTPFNLETGKDEPAYKPIEGGLKHTDNCPICGKAMLKFTNPDSPYIILACPTHMGLLGLSIVNKE